MTHTPGGRRWRRRTRKIPEPVRPAEPVGDDSPIAAASAVQMAIGLLTASLDSPELEEWAACFLVPEDPEALAKVIAGLHLVNLLLLHELHEVTGHTPASTLQKLAILAASGPQPPCTR
jgi:hypothetical protein